MSTNIKSSVVYWMDIVFLITIKLIMCRVWDAVCKYAENTYYQQTTNCERRAITAYSNFFIFMINR